MSDKITFWKYIQDNKIEIPIIQRDYAQGRLGNENLRKNFLSDLKKALDNESPYKDTVMKLDFVYGSTEDGILNPLDGQQRLTTLWLLHWYIALRAGELNENNRKIFERFTYETRISSRDFCQKLCVPKNFEDFDGNDIVGFITKQTWFYSAWKQDPTIQSMLRMLGGTKITDNKGEDIVDGIEELFQNTNEDTFKDYWRRLTEKEIIVFYHLPLSDFGLSDDLYIKMNARGKQLTSFENFKADLIGYITKQTEDEALGDDIRAEWKNLLDPESGIPIKLDTDWTDIFWRNKSNDNRIDEIYFAFINRFFFQKIICAKKEDNANYLFTVNDLEENGTFNFLYGNKSDDSQIQYSGIERYLYQEKSKIPFSLFNSFKNALNHYESGAGCPFFSGCCLKGCFPTWADSEFEFIPKYNLADQISTLGQKERVVFLAVCKYLEKGEFESSSFKQWMRVVWNIVENSGIETIPAMIGAMRLIDELHEHSHAIYDFLSNPLSHIESSFAKEQVSEEIIKAKQILLGKARTDENTWEEIIIAAESDAFFKGAIRFLFTEGDGKINWCDFDTKWKNAQKFFVQDGVKNDYAVSLTRALVIQCDNWEEQLYDKQIFRPNANTWKWIFTAKNWIAPIHNILMGNIISATKENKDEDIKKYFTPIIEHLPFEFIINNEPDGRFRWFGGKLCFYKPNGREKATLDWENWRRNKILSSLLKSNVITTDAQMGDSDMFWGWNVNFVYRDKYFFQWYGNPNDKELDVYLMEDNWADYKKRQPPTTDKGTDEDSHYCFRVDENTTADSFAKSLDNLISQAYPQESNKT